MLIGKRERRRKSVCSLNRRGEWSEIACRKRREERRLERERGMTGQGETRQRKIDASLCKKDASFPTLRFSSLHSSLSHFPLLTPYPGLKLNFFELHRLAVIFRAINEKLTSASLLYFPLIYFMSVIQLL